MNRHEAFEQYNIAHKQAQKYYKSAVIKGAYPYPSVLDDILDESMIAGREDIGLVDVPSELIVGTQSGGRKAALAGNFMPLLKEGSEFATKWINLCCAHLSDEGIREPVVCSEYMGKFYVQEGNKRVSVLKSFGAPTIPAYVTRIIPVYSDDDTVKAYYAFMRFYKLSKLYSVQFSNPDAYAKLQEAMGFEPEYVWNNDDRRHFTAGYTHFASAFNKASPETSNITLADALAACLQIFAFSEIKEFSHSELCSRISAIWPDIINYSKNEPVSVSTHPAVTEKNIISKIMNVSRTEHIKAAFIYAFDPESSIWTSAHLDGQHYLSKSMRDKVEIKSYFAFDHDFDRAINEAISEGAELIFATTPTMIKACRKAAAEHPRLKVLNCSPTLPYTGIRAYYSRIHESKFIAGALAGAMAANNKIGYIANYPICGVPAGVNAFALGAKLTNPKAEIILKWSSIPGDPLMELIEQGVTVISNKDASSPENAHWALDWGTYKFLEDGSMQPIAIPCWDWGRFYEKVTESIFSGVWDRQQDKENHRAINYWWGMDSGVIDIQLSGSMPEGLICLADILKKGIINNTIPVFKRVIHDQSGAMRNDGEQSFSPEEIINMDWFCDCVEGQIPKYEEILPQHREMIDIIGLYKGVH